MKVGIFGKIDIGLKTYLSNNGHKVINLLAYDPADVKVDAILVIHPDKILHSDSVRNLDPYSVADQYFISIMRYLPSLVNPRNKIAYILYITRDKIKYFDKYVVSRLKQMYNIRRVVKLKNVRQGIRAVVRALQKYFDENYERVEFKLSIYRVSLAYQRVRKMVFEDD